MNAATDRPLGPGGRIALAGPLLIGAAMARTDLVTLIDYVAYAAIGAFLVTRRPRNLIGWLLIGIGAGFIGTTGPADRDVAALTAGTAPLGDFLWAWVGPVAGGMSWILYSTLALIFPTGHLPAGRWRRPMLAALALAAVIVVLPQLWAPTIPFSPDGGVTEILVPNRLAVLPPIGDELRTLVQVVVTALPILVLAIAVVSTIARYRRSAEIVRLQLRWLMSSVAFVVIAVTAGIMGFGLVGEQVGGLVWIPAIVAFPTVPIAVGVAVTRYRLFEIDRIVSRTLGWAIVTGALVAVFATLVVGLQTVLVGVTQGQTLAVAASTLAAFALFQPVRRRVQSAVDRRFDRARYDAPRTADAFAEQLRNEVDLARLRTALVATANDAVKPATASVWLRVGTGGAS